MRLDEITGDDQFDRMIGRVTGNTEPSVDADNKGIDRKTHELTYRIFLALRDYDDPATTEKFRQFMQQTLNTDVGPIDEEKNPQPVNQSSRNRAIEQFFDQVRQNLSNANINIEPYNSPGFRISQINAAIKRLEYVRNMLAAEDVISRANRE